MATGHPDWAGEALVHGCDLVFDHTSYTLAGDGETSTPMTQITKPGYFIRLDANSSGSAPTFPFLWVQVYWYEPNGVYSIADQSWIIPVSESATVIYKVMGAGPTRGNYVQMYFYNLDSSVSMIVNVTMVETTQHIGRDDLRGLPDESGITIPNYTLFPNYENNPLNYLASDAISMGDDASITRLMPLYAGPVMLTAQVAAGGSQQNISVVDAYTGYVLYAGSATPTAPVNGQVLTLGRAPCLFKATNTGAGATTLSVMIVAQEIAS